MLANPCGDRRHVQAFDLMPVLGRPPVAASPPDPRREQLEVPGRDGVDGDPHQRGLDDPPPLQGSGQLLSAEITEACPQRHVPRGRVLSLQSGQALERARKRKG
jgi:hypothetical protein